MPTNTLTPEQLAALRAYYGLTGAGATQPGAYRDPSGRIFQNNAPTATGENNVGFAQPSDGYLSYTDDDNHVGGTYQRYGLQGEDQGTGTFQEVNGTKDFLTALAAAGAMYFGLPALMEGAGAGAAGATGSFIPGVDSALASQQLGLTAADVGAGGAAAADFGTGANVLNGEFGAAGGGFETMGPQSMMDFTPTQGLTPFNYGGTAGYTPFEAGFSGTGAISGPEALAGAGYVNPASIVSGAGLSGLTGWGSLIGPAASLVGGLLGSQPQTRTQTQQTQIDPRLAPYIYGQGGLLQGVQGQLARSTSPEARANWDAIGAKGMSMLSAPVAGNGFSMLTGR